VQMFVDRAQAVRASFALTVENFSDVASACRHLDGLPLAIELAAARAKLLGPRALVARLDKSLDLRGPGADRPTRQQALRDTIDWSYQLLPSAQQALFRRLGVFAGGADVEAVAAVWAGGGDSATQDADLVDLVADLVDASLVTVAEDDDGEPRFRLLETVRAFALDALGDADGLYAVRWAHAAHFVDVANRLDFLSIWGSREQALRGNRLFESEWNNFREAVAWATARPAEPEPDSSGRLALGLT